MRAFQKIKSSDSLQTFIRVDLPLGPSMIAQVKLPNGITLTVYQLEPLEKLSALIGEVSSCST